VTDWAQVLLATWQAVHRRVSTGRTMLFYMVATMPWKRSLSPALAPFLLCLAFFFHHADGMPPLLHRP
jgi:hypothetical protein